MSEIEIPFASRIESAARFHQFHSESTRKSWVEKFLEVSSSDDYGMPELLVLLDPKNYLELEASDPRGGNFKTSKEIRKCRSLELWGYSCPYTDSKIHIDHTFPWSKGGVTHFQNAMYLCDEHNRAKSIDVHLIPWENFRKNNAWIEESLRHLISYASRKTSEKLYFPKAKFVNSLEKR